jgi:hypothetical protein
MVKQRRDKYGRFAPKRRNVKLKPYLKPNRLHGRFAPRATVKGPKPKRGFKQSHWKVLQTDTPIEVDAYGYYMVIRALVPGGWQTDSTPTFITQAPEESLHQVVWRTPVRENLFLVTESSLLADLRDEAKGLIKAELSLAKSEQKEICILSCELRILTAPYESFQVDTWPGIIPPKWLRNVK